MISVKKQKKNLETIELFTCEFIKEIHDLARIAKKKNYSICIDCDNEHSRLFCLREVVCINYACDQGDLVEFLFDEKFNKYNAFDFIVYKEVEKCVDVCTLSVAVDVSNKQVFCGASKESGSVIRAFIKENNVNKLMDISIQEVEGKLSVRCVEIV